MATDESWMVVRVVAASRMRKGEFQRTSLLGHSVQRLAYRPGIRITVACGNARGLPEVYNEVIDKASPDEILVFTHDDVRFDDWLLIERVREALAHFDVAGVVGSRRRVPGQATWAGRDTTATEEELTQLSGAIAQRDGDAEVTYFFGATPARVVLLDGVFLAVRAETLQRTGIRFDPRFRFEFYDLDFCRTCDAAGLRLGTWPIAITHASRGRFDSDGWRAAYRAYLEKWGE